LNLDAEPYRIATGFESRGRSETRMSVDFRPASKGDIPAVILAGGQGRRMGGADKAFLTLAGRPLVAHLVSRLAAQCAPIAINANGDTARFAAFGLPVLPDSAAGQPGPLAGILAALDWAAGIGAGAVVTAAVDTPFLPPDLVLRLAAAAGASGAAIVASSDAAGRMRLHPTVGLWPVSARDGLRARLAAGERKVMLWAEALAAGVAEFQPTPHDPFFNINTPEDLAAAERTAAG
jgi:molybdenum cofactor guanylyltransferase